MSNRSGIMTIVFALFTAFASTAILQSCVRFEKSSSPKSDDDFPPLTTKDICVIEATVDDEPLSLTEKNLVAPSCIKTKKLEEKFKTISGAYGVVTLVCLASPEPISKVAVPFLGASTAMMGTITFITSKWPCEGPEELTGKKLLAVQKASCEIIGKQFSIKDKKGFCE